MSALWHGQYPGYYLFFLSVPVVQQLEKALSARVRPRMHVGASFFEIYHRVFICLSRSPLSFPFINRSGSWFIRCSPVRYCGARVFPYIFQLHRHAVLGSQLGPHDYSVGVSVLHRSYHSPRSIGHHFLLPLTEEASETVANACRCCEC
jgi:hypothetical protein